MASFSIPVLREMGFSGFCQIGTLRSERCAGIPAMPGVYIVLNSGSYRPQFLQKGTGGFFKNKDPNISIEALERKWVPGSPIVYIGKAGGSKSKRTLQKRLREYAQFGSGLPVPHWGGRLIWQLPDSENLDVCWRPYAEAASLETELLALHVAEFGALPFANLRR